MEHSKSSAKGKVHSNTGLAQETRKKSNKQTNSKYQTTWPASWETCMQVRKQQLESDMEQHTGSK